MHKVNQLFPTSKDGNHFNPDFNFSKCGPVAKAWYEQELLTKKAKKIARSSSSSAAANTTIITTAPPSGSKKRSAPASTAAGDESALSPFKKKRGDKNGREGGSLTL